MTSFNLASSTLLGLEVAEVLSEGVPKLLLQEEFAQGATAQSLSLYVSYESFLPDTSVVSPFNFEVLAIVEQEQEDNSWEEIGRQNQPIRKLSQGATRQIIVSPANAGVEEGVDLNIAGFSGNPVRLKSLFADEAAGKIRVSVYVVDNAPAGAHPFESVTVSINGRRY